MALSSYEQKVWKEIESELTLNAPGAWARCGAWCRRYGGPVAVTVALVFVAALAGVLGTFNTAVVCGAVASFLLGLIWGSRKLPGIRTWPRSAKWAARMRRRR